jgi:inner membrane protein
MKTRLEHMRSSVTGKVLFIGVLTLALLIPMGMIQGLINERTYLYETARADIANGWGEAQTVGAPILIVPFQHTRLSYTQPQYTQPVTVTDELYLLPKELEFGATAEPEERRRGIYKVPVYTARLHVAGTFNPPQIDGEHQDLEILWNQAELALPLSDARSIKDPVRLQVGAATAEFQPGGERVAGFGPQLVARYADLGLGALGAPQAFSFDLVLGGTGTLRFLPLGDATRASITSTWPSPSFGGAYLPESPPSVDDAGFAARWRMLALGRGYPSTWLRSGPLPQPQRVAASAFGVDLITPVGIHESSMRAAKYAVLFIGLTFVAYFLFELFADLRVHTLQYLLIGFANCVFYLLLLALAEHIGFAPAYLASAIASTALISMYSAAALRSLRRALPIVGLLGALYGYLYVTLRAEDYALLFGALGLFAVLATFMYLTRRIDWYNVSFEPKGTAEPRVQLHA